MILLKDIIHFSYLIEIEIVLRGETRLPPLAHSINDSVNL
jgi:hypothetical protein